MVLQVAPYFGALQRTILDKERREAGGERQEEGKKKQEEGRQKQEAGGRTWSGFIVYRKDPIRVCKGVNSKREILWKAFAKGCEN